MRHFVIIDNNFDIGSKPALLLCFTNQLTKVNGNKNNSSVIILPSAFADGIVKQLFK